MKNPHDQSSAAKLFFFFFFFADITTSAPSSSCSVSMVRFFLFLADGASSSTAVVEVSAAVVEVSRALSSPAASRVLFRFFFFFFLGVSLKYHSHVPVQVYSMHLLLLSIHGDLLLLCLPTLTLLNGRLHDIHILPWHSSSLEEGQSLLNLLTQFRAEDGGLGF